jgi:hypothetical protein
VDGVLGVEGVGNNFLDKSVDNFLHTLISLFPAPHSTAMVNYAMRRVKDEISGIKYKINDLKLFIFYG